MTDYVPDAYDRTVDDILASQGKSPLTAGQHAAARDEMGGWGGTQPADGPCTLDAETESFLVELDGLAAADLSAGGAIDQALQRMLLARGTEIRPRLRELEDAGAGGFLRLLAGQDPIGFMCLARWEDDCDALPEGLLAPLRGREAELRARSWERVEAAWGRHESRVAAEVAVSIGRGLRKDEREGIQHLLMVTPPPGVRPAGERQSSEDGLPPFMRQGGGA